MGTQGRCNWNDHKLKAEGSPFLLLHRRGLSEECPPVSRVFELTFDWNVARKNIGHVEESRTTPPLGTHGRRLQVASDPCSYFLSVACSLSSSLSLSWVYFANIKPIKQKFILKRLSFIDASADLSYSFDGGYWGCMHEEVDLLSLFLSLIPTLSTCIIYKFVL